MIEGTYYKEWSAVLGREMEFKVFGQGGCPVLALPGRGGRFYDWEDQGLVAACAPLLHAGRMQLFCADGLDGEGLLDADLPLRRRAEMQEEYFCYLTRELAPRILALNAAEDKEEKTALWCAGVDIGAYQAVNCRLRRPALFAGAVGLSGLYDLHRFAPGQDIARDDLWLRNSPTEYLGLDGLVDKALLAEAQPDQLTLCAGQGPYEQDALADTQALAQLLQAQGLPVHLEVWGNDVAHDWYWWGRQWNLFAERLFGQQSKED